MKTPVHAIRANIIASGTRFAATGSRIERLILIIVRRACRLGQILAGTGARIYEPRIAQPLPSAQIMFTTLALHIGREWATTIRPFLPFQTQPLQIFDHGCNEMGLAAVR